ncbi:MAG: pilus assembly protein [Alphaproteobacteria bacterium]|nr:pilus assembly protein [Alphaproteobacteria bacterium]
MGFWKAYFREKKAATAVEFSLVALPLIYLLIGILEISLFFATSSVIHGASSQAARLIKTGQLQQGGGDAEQIFSDALCANADFMVRCGDIRFEVVPLSDGFSSFADMPAEYDSDGNFTPRPFDAGGVNDVIMVRSVYPYHFVTPLLSVFMTGARNSVKTIMATVIFQTEPYDFSDS